MIDEKGRLFGKLNIVDLLVILVVLVAVVVLVGLFCGWLACLLWQRFAAWRGLEA